MRPLGDLRRDLSHLQDIVAELRAVMPPALTEFADAVEADIAAFEPRVSLIGQVKAGKTALANALIGAPDLLPSDVNPWTSVVTAVHLNGEPPSGHGAVFRFFDEEDWNALVESGGRFGELASRADAGDEATAIAGQVAALRARTSERLGRNYKLLLGQAHRFREFTPDLVRRYVCLGDEAESDSEGRFADLTRSADLYVRAPEFALPLVIEDTPGVNDPFLVREQMTIETLERASICVLVLSAYQALSTVDLGLMRLLRTLRADQVVIFVNRVDELTDRAAEIPRIERSIRAVLGRNGLEGEVRIVFGSAVWAQRVMTGDLSDLDAEDWDVLTDPGLGNPDRPAEESADDRQALQQHMRDLSGLPDLKEALAECIARGPGRTALRRLARRVGDLVSQSAAHLDSFRVRALGLDEVAAAERLDHAIEALERRLSSIERGTMGEIEALHASVVGKWIDGNAAELGTADEIDTSALRGALTKAYEEIAGEAEGQIERLLEEVEGALRRIYASLLGEGASLFPMTRPHAESFGRPTPLARSSSFDLRGGWLEGLRSGRVRDARREGRFRDMAHREFQEILSEVQRGPVRDGFARAGQTLHDFVLPHVRTIQALAADGGRTDSNVTLMTARTAELRGTLGALGERLDALAGVSSKKTGTDRT